MYFKPLPGTIIAGALVVFQFIFLYSCGGSPPAAEREPLLPEHDTVLKVVEREEKIDSALKIENNVPFVELKFSLLLMEGPAENFFNTAVYNGKNTQQYIEDTIAKWKEDYNSLWNGPDAQDGYWASLCGEYHETHTHALYPDMLVVKRIKYTYTGGAHGSENSEYLILDLKEQKRLFLDDLIVAEKKDGLLPLLKKALSSVENSERVHFDDVFVAENVFYDPKGIGFYWNEYEIASYADGQFEVIVPHTELSDLLTDKGKSLFGY
jgi:hypothetical protein